MRRLIAILMVLSGGMVLTTAANADDVDDVKAAVLKLDAALNAGDVDTIAQYIHPEASRFGFRRRLLSEGFCKDRLKAGFDAGLKFDLGRIRHLGVKIYGNSAVVTFYRGASVTSPNGTIRRGTRRASGVWIKQQGKWKVVHSHASQLKPRSREVIPPPAATGQ